MYLRFYLHNPFRCNGIYDKETDEHVTPEKLIMIVNRLYELDKKFVLKVLECNEDECFLCEYDDLCIMDYHNDYYDVFEG